MLQCISAIIYICAKNLGNIWCIIALGFVRQSIQSANTITTAAPAAAAATSDAAAATAAATSTNPAATSAI